MEQETVIVDVTLVDCEPPSEIWPDTVNEAEPATTSASISVSTVSEDVTDESQYVLLATVASTVQAILELALPLPAQLSRWVVAIAAA